MLRTGPVFQDGMRVPLCSTDRPACLAPPRRCGNPAAEVL